MPVPLPEEIVAVVLRELADVAEVDEERLTPEAVLEDLDIDSLDIVELGQIIEERFGVQLDGNSMKGIETVGEACRVVIAQVLHQPVT
jgi:acyl carrier protein